MRYRGALIGLADRIARSERTRTDSPLTKEAEKGLWAYLEGPLREQILLERNGEIPGEASIVFGHTHKPFQEDLNFSGYPQWVGCYNTGGWVVESTQPQLLHGGAAVLADEGLNLTALRMYNEAENRGEYKVKVEEAGYADGSNPFHQRISDLVDPAAEPWKSFSDITADEIHIRARNLRARINSGNER